jgi:hypothetical protein
LPELTELELVFELKTWMNWDGWSYRASLWDHAIKNFWASSNEAALMLSKKIKDGLDGKTLIVDGKVKKAPNITIILRSAGFQDYMSCNMIRTRCGTDYLESERFPSEFDRNAEYHIRHRIKKGKPMLRRGTYRELESDITDFWMDLEGLAMKHYDRGIVIGDKQAELPYQKFGFASSGDFVRACFRHAVARHRHVLMGVNVHDKAGLREQERINKMFLRSVEDDGW